MSVLAVSVGDPAGVGPEVSAEAAAEHRSLARLVLFGDGERLERVLRGRGCPVDRVPPDGELSGPEGSVGVAHTSTWSSGVVDARRPTLEGGKAQIAMLRGVSRAVLEGRAQAVVTGPVSKEAISLSGQRFEGHTEWFAEAAGLDHDAVTMMFLGPRLSVALATTHLSIRDVPDSVTSDRVERTVRHLVAALTAWRGKSPRVVEVCGLNPHAGEGGLFGTEETFALAPALGRARRDAGSECRIVGPSPSEAAFRRAAAGETDGVVAMFHDQATIASKLLDFGSAVNVTWGLPFVRTSVDHGVAYDVAGTGRAEASGMCAAVVLAAQLVAEGRGYEGSPGGDAVVDAPQSD